MLPCADIDEIADFATALGFTVTYRQTRPNPYLALRREDMDLHYFGIEGFRPEDSYGTCGVVTADPKLLFDAFAAGLRSRYGRLPLAGFPRITRPRRRKNADGFTGFSLIDPGGNWIRVIAGRADDAGDDAAPAGRLARTLADAVVLADSHGDVDQAAKILGGAVRRHSADASPGERVEALAYLAELAVRRGDDAAARAALIDLSAVELSAAERAAAAGPLGEAAELLEALPAADGVPGEEHAVLLEHLTRARAGRRRAARAPSSRASPPTSAGAIDRSSSSTTPAVSAAREQLRPALAEHLLEAPVGQRVQRGGQVDVVVPADQHGHAGGGQRRPAVGVGRRAGDQDRGGDGAR